MSDSGATDPIMEGIEFFDGDWPYGLACVRCSHVFCEGERYSTILESFADDAPVVHVVCMPCVRLGCARGMMSDSRRFYFVPQQSVYHTDPECRGLKRVLTAIFSEPFPPESMRLCRWCNRTSQRATPDE